MSSVIIFPEFEELKNETEKLRTELSMLMLERDELCMVECKNIEMAYMLKLGSLEYKVFETQCSFLRLKRKVELIQAKKNRQEKVNIQDIETLLDNEFAEYQEKLEEQLNKMNSALDRSKGKFLSDEDAHELKQLYHKIVKALHPDLNPNLTPAQQGLFYRAVSAYENGDLDSMRIIAEMLPDTARTKPHEDAMSELIKERDRLKKLIETVKENIEKIKSEYPYNVKDLVRNEEKIAERRAELKNALEQYEEAIKSYKDRIEELLR